MAFVDGARIRLKGNLGVGTQVEPLADPLEQTPDRVTRKEARSAAAEENRENLPLRCQCRLALQVGDNRVNVTGFWYPIAHRVGIEIAIRALAHAPGDVNVFYFPVRPCAIGRLR